MKIFDQSTGRISRLVHCQYIRVCCDLDTDMIGKVADEAETRPLVYELSYNITGLLMNHENGGA